MTTPLTHLNRRDFVTSLAMAGGTLALAGAAPSIVSAAETPAAKRNIKLGFDNFSVRAMKWNASQLIDYAISLKVDTLLLSNLEVYESFEEPYLRGLKAKADQAGLDLQVGTNSICPSSSAFNNKYGTGEEHLSLAIRTAKALGSPVARCVLGNGGDRNGEGGIYPHIEDTVKVCKNVRSLAVDSGVKIAIENHAGDMQSWELVDLIEAAGKDYVAATMDSGNATWTVESPLASLEILGPYAVTTGIRDSAIWENEKGASVQWTNMGNGAVDWGKYLDRFAALCPGVPFILEIISGGPREFNYLEDDFWKVYPRARAIDLAHFAALAKHGKPAVDPPGRPTGSTPEETPQLQQKFDLEQSLAYCRNTLGLGLKG
jgi:sugar phosphate isomerase/epimerase